MRCGRSARAASPRPAASARRSSLWGSCTAAPSPPYVDESFTAHMARVSRARRIPVAIEVGAPIATVGQDVGEVRDEVHRAVQALVHRARARLAADG